MIKMKFSIDINAPANKIWNILWDDITYRQWTKVFADGSYAVSNWNEGEKVHFLKDDGDGMYSIIEKCIPNELMLFRHIGEIKNGRELPVSPEAEQWSGSEEKYILRENNGHTSLNVEVDFSEEYKEFFDEKFPEALRVVKSLAEEKI